MQQNNSSEIDQTANNDYILDYFLHRGPTINDILSKVASVKYITLKNANSRYHNLKLDEKLSEPFLHVTLVDSAMQTTFWSCAGW